MNKPDNRRLQQSLTSPEESLTLKTSTLLSQEVRAETMEASRLKAQTHAQQVDKCLFSTIAQRMETAWLVFRPTAQRGRSLDK